MTWLGAGSSADDEREHDLDESDVRVRANPLGSRPRTKVRPGHRDALPGWVLSVTRSRFQVLVAAGTPAERVLLAARARDLRVPVVTGDEVALVGDCSGEPGTLARLVRVSERRSVLRRSADDVNPAEQVLVANADQLLIVVAAADPEPRPRLIDRALVAAMDAGIRPLLCVTKTDLGDPEPVLAHVAGLDLATFERLPGTALGSLRAALAGHRTVVVGHSGVGKSTLVNLLAPEAQRATGHVNAVTGRGRHTSASSIAVRLSDLPPGEGAPLNGPESGDPGWIIDTPGVRSLGLAHIDPAHILHAFADCERITDTCPRGCTHLADAPDCALDDSQATLDTARVDSLRRLLATLTPTRTRR